MHVQRNKRILVAPLNWGLGHATRCIPIINALIENNFEPLIASDGQALRLLKREFPNLKAISLPSYNITYPKTTNNLKLKFIKETPHFLNTIRKEKKLIQDLIEKENISGIISDNRFGVRHNAIPSVFITHQLRVLSGNTTWISSRLHQNIISKFDECWVPDNAQSPNLSGDLGHLKNCDGSIKYIGAMSRFNKIDLPIKYGLLVILSGPEPQRTYLEKSLLETLKKYPGKILFINGKVENKQTKITKGHITIYNFMTSQALETAMNESALVLSRSGYTTIMDLAKLEKKAFFIPTPGQFEQEYLAKKLKQEKVAPSCKQNDFEVSLLNDVENYSGFKSSYFKNDYKKLFSLF